MFPPLDRVAGALDQLDDWIDRPDLTLRREAVSAWSLCEQLDHVLKVAGAMLGRLAEEGKEPKTPISIQGRVVLRLGWIPRGVGKAPEATRGLPATAAELRAALERVRQLVARLDADPSRLTHRRRTVRHPRFGGLTPAQALRFLEIHTRHHLKILRDIVIVRT